MLQGCILDFAKDVQQVLWIDFAHDFYQATRQLALGVVTAPLHEPLSVTEHAVECQYAEVALQLGGVGDVASCLVEQGLYLVTEGRIAQRCPSHQLELALVTPVRRDHGCVGAVYGADFPYREMTVVANSDGYFVVDEPQGGVGARVSAIVLLVVGNPAAHVDGFAELVGHDHTHRVDAHEAGVFIDIVPIGEVHAAAFAQAHEVKHALFAVGCQPASAGVAVGGLSQQQGDTFVGIVLYTPHADDAVISVHAHHLVKSQGLASGQVQDAMRQFLSIVVKVELIAVEHQRVLTDACIGQEIVAVVDAIARLPFATAGHESHYQKNYNQMSHIVPTFIFYLLSLIS